MKPSPAPGPVALVAFAATLSLAALFSLAGCGASPNAVTAPATKNDPGYETDGVPPHLWIGVLDRGRHRLLPAPAFSYPLVPGRVARYGVYLRSGPMTDSVPDFTPWFGFERIRTITCSVPSGDRVYTAERWSHINAATNWLMLRQDRRGLYEADGFLYSPPACETMEPARAAQDEPGAGWLARDFSALAARPEFARNPAAWRAAWTRSVERTSRVLEAMGRGPLPGASGPVPGPPEGELLRLSYPLRPGRTWVVRQDPLFVSTVERIEVLSLPAGRMVGARIRLTSDLYPGNADVLEWYGAEGFLRLTARFVEDVTDEYGNVIGRYVSEMEERVEEIERGR